LSIYSLRDYLLILLSFIFYWSGDRRVLHSFPTRRSSDLRGARHRQARRGALRSLQARLQGGILAERGWRFKASTPICAVSFDPRSEEHTSELQSRENLVCRLLLEKKKEKTLMHIYQP